MSEQASLLDLIGNDPRHDDEYLRFVDACYQAAILDGRWLVSINRVRTMMRNDWGMTIEPRRYSSFWRRARLDGTLERTTQIERIKGSGNGRNDGKPTFLYRWIGGAR